MMHKFRLAAIVAGFSAALFFGHTELGVAKEPKEQTGWITVAAEDVDKRWPSFTTLQKIMAIKALIL